jgi:hypothetical protein
MTMKRFLGLTAMAFLWTGKLPNLHHEEQYLIFRVIVQVLKSRFTFSAAFLPISMPPLAEQIDGFGLYVLYYPPLSTN